MFSTHRSVLVYNLVYEQGSEVSVHEHAHAHTARIHPNNQFKSRFADRKQFLVCCGPFIVLSIQFLKGILLIDYSQKKLFSPPHFNFAGSGSGSKMYKNALKPEQLFYFYIPALRQLLH